jgi:hypothetical protein
MTMLNDFESDESGTSDNEPTTPASPAMDRSRSGSLHSRPRSDIESAAGSALASVQVDTMQVPSSLQNPVSPNQARRLRWTDGAPLATHPDSLLKIRHHSSTPSDADGVPVSPTNLPAQSSPPNRRKGVSLPLSKSPSVSAQTRKALLARAAASNIDYPVPSGQSATALASATSTMLDEPQPAAELSLRLPAIDPAEIQALRARFPTGLIGRASCDFQAPVDEAEALSYRMGDLFVSRKLLFLFTACATGKRRAELIRF